MLEYKPDLTENKSNAPNTQTLSPRNPQNIKREDNPLLVHQTQASGPVHRDRAKKKQGRKTKRTEEELGSNGITRGRDFYEECVEMSSSLETIPNKKIWFKVHKQERLAVQERISHGHSAGGGSTSELELSEESDSGLNDPDKGMGPNKSTERTEEISKEEDLQKQIESYSRNVPVK
ncbi:uncharacterized protein LOC125294622 [Alosa alosa]|uniref:uncharacterized protein LOC125294622 n=1 Tax=Alosa alosa TaxID=278164 RepID=UPI0020151A91|nr:uncharacterized protein LOC125294622 [Alosa alosa]